MSKMNPLQGFLRRHASKDDSNITHTRIGNAEMNVFGGKYSIPEDKKDEFWKIYNKHVFTNKQLEFLTEKQREVGPILIDLDFRHNKEVEERQYDENHIQDFCELYVEKLAQLVDIKEPFDVYVMQKPEVNTCEQVTKDGIHIVIGINVHRALRTLLRSKVLDTSSSSNITNILDDLNLTNTPEDVVDEGIARGTTNWQVYGSGKPGFQRYKITKHFTISPDGEGDFEWEENEIRHSLGLLTSVSAQNSKNKVYEVRDSYKEEFEKVKASEGKKRIRIKPKKNNGLGGNLNQMENSMSSLDVGSFENSEQLRKKVSEYIEGLDGSENYKMKETYYFVDALSKKYYEPYDAWIRVGWALFNTSCSILSFMIWMAFSSKSCKFDISKMDEFYDTWCNMKSMRDGFSGLTDYSIMFWCKNDNPTAYMKIKSQTVDYYIELTLDGATEFDIAMVMFQLYKDKYKCVSIKHNLWYEFKDGRWKPIDSGTSLRMKISKQLNQKYIAKVAYWTGVLNDMPCPSESTNGDNSEKYKAIQNKAKKFTEIGLMLKKTNHKKNIMRECSELFYEEDFIDKLDKNPYLLCFKNGVVDFKEKVFREGTPEDYLSISTNTYYTPYDSNCVEQVKIRAEICEFMHQLFPHAELYEYMWQHLSSVLIGTNENQTFNIYNGCGRNGKSKLVELMEKILGDYKGTVPITLVTAKRNSIGSASPEIAMLQGRRYAVMQEPTKGDVINEGIMKEITGGDPIQGRALYQNTVTYVPQFSLVVCTNNLFDIKSQDDGTWRRIRICEFMSKFVEDPDEDEPYEFKINKKLPEKFDTWVPVMTAMLVEKAFETNGIVKDCDIVMQKSNAYREELDYVAQFVNNRVVVEEDSIIRKTDIWSEFTQWYEAQYGKKDKPKAKDLYAYMDKKFHPNKGRPWKNLRLILQNDPDNPDSD
jgi:P4 family phage/plasmid primase-like protien